MNQGFSMVEALVAIGVATTGILAVSSGVSYSLKGQKSVQSRLEITDTRWLVSQFLGDPKNCTALVQGASPGAPLVLELSAKESPKFITTDGKKSESKSSTLNFSGIYLPGSSGASSGRSLAEVNRALNSGAVVKQITLQSVEKFSQNQWLGQLSLSMERPNSLGNRLIAEAIPLVLKTKSISTDRVQVEGCVGRDSAPQLCQDLGGAYDENRTPRCVVPPAPVSCATGVMKGILPNGQPDCAPAPGLRALSGPLDGNLHTEGAGLGGQYRVRRVTVPAGFNPKIAYCATRQVGRWGAWGHMTCELEAITATEVRFRIYCHDGNNNDYPYNRCQEYRYNYFVLGS
ncbi:MAG: hypothetical protein AB7P04_11475 [Bacteriovoracia bacterium]